MAFVTIPRYVTDVSPYVLALAKRAGLDIDKAIEAARVASDKRYAETAKHDERVLVYGKLASWKVMRARNGDKYYVLRFPSGFEVVWRPSNGFMKLPIGERVARLTDVVLIEAVEDGNRFRAKRIKFMRTRADYATLKEVLRLIRDENHPVLNHLGLAAARLFVKPDGLPGTDLQLAVRFALLAGGVMHVAEWSVKAVLKSTMFSMFEDYAGWWHITGERPSLATLIGDARTGVSRLAGVDGVAFDEIGSWRRNRAADDEGWWAAIRTGLANCKWKRSKGGSKSIEFERCVATYWAGNPRGKPLGKNVIPPIEYHRLWLQEQGLDGEELLAMLSRFSGFWSVVSEDVADDTMRRIHLTVPTPGVFRAIAETVKRITLTKEPPAAPCDLDARQHVHWRSVYPAIRAIVKTRADAEKIACGIVRGLLVVHEDGYEVVA